MKFKCYRCFHCCFFTSPNEYPIITESEMKKLEEVSHKYNVRLQFKYLGGIFYLWIINGFCPFYDIANNSCKIHKQKPISCKMFPLLLNIRTGEVHISYLCDWVQANLRKENIDPQEVVKAFKSELEVAIKLYNQVTRQDSRLGD